MLRKSFVSSHLIFTVNNVIKSTYVLPDGVTHTKGYVKDPQGSKSFLTLSDKEYYQSHLMDMVGEKKKADMNKNETNERFLVPETLFQPADLGMNQAGLAECIVRSISSCHSYLQPVLYQSIILTGGSTLFPQLKQRLERGLRPLVPDHFDVKITAQEDPIVYGEGVHFWLQAWLLNPCASPRLNTKNLDQLDVGEDFFIEGSKK